MLRELGEKYVNNVRHVYEGNVHAGSDLVVYWFGKAINQISKDRANRVGLIATQSIRAGYNRQILDAIKKTGDIFLAWSDREWILDGAAVRVSIIGFDSGKENIKVLDGQHVEEIFSNLTSSIDVTKANQLNENKNLIARGIETGGPFELSEVDAYKLFSLDEKNKQIVVPIVNGNDITGRSRGYWVIDFLQTPEDKPENYEAAFNKLHEMWQTVLNDEKLKRKPQFREDWWGFRRSGESLRRLIKDKKRYIITPRVAKHRFFIFLDYPTMPDSRLFVVGREDDYFFGVLHSRVHEVWSLATSSRHGDGDDGGRPTYNNTTCFETFPFPWPPGTEPSAAEDARVAEIAHWARALNDWREAWLNPPRDGMYAGLGDAYDNMVKKRTLTNLYNGLVYYRETRPSRSGRPRRSDGETTLFLQTEFDKVTRKSVTRADIQELDDIHTALDHAVLDAYGWLPSTPSTSSGDGALTDEEILEHLLAHNLQRAAK